MKLYFLRHGLAGDPGQWTGPDFERPLTKEGHERMSREAKTIAALSLDLDVIVTSPLVRARQSAQIVANALKVGHKVVEDERLGHDFSTESLAALLQSHHDAEAIMLVGHEPSMGQVIGKLIGDARLDFKKGSLARVDLPEATNLQGQLVWLVPPKVLAL